MGKKDPRVDAYISKAAPFARPILTRIRDIVHASCPDVEEAIKWRFPHFMYKGMLCSMAAFKQHAAFGFWKGSLVTGGPRREGRKGQADRYCDRNQPPEQGTPRHVSHWSTSRAIRAGRPNRGLAAVS